MEQIIIEDNVIIIDDNDIKIDDNELLITDFKPTYEKAKAGRPKKAPKEPLFKRTTRGRPKKEDNEPKFEDQRKEYNRLYYLKNNYLVECSCCKISIPKINMNKHLKAIYHIENYNNSIKK